MCGLNNRLRVHADVWHQDWLRPRPQRPDPHGRPATQSAVIVLLLTGVAQRAAAHMQPCLSGSGNAALL